jgi:hypothetical protein
MAGKQTHASLEKIITAENNQYYIKKPPRNPMKLPLKNSKQQL